MTDCGWVNVLLIEGASEEPLGIEEEGGGRVRERLSLTATDEGCGVDSIFVRLRREKTTFTAVKMVSLTWEQILSCRLYRDLSTVCLLIHFFSRSL